MNVHVAAIIIHQETFIRNVSLRIILLLLFMVGIVIVNGKFYDIFARGAITKEQ